MMERCAHSGPEANDGPCEACSQGPGPLPPDATLTFSERFSHTEWGAPVFDGPEVASVKPKRARKWLAVFLTVGAGMAVVAVLVTTLMVGTGAHKSATVPDGPRYSVSPSPSAPLASPSGKPSRLDTRPLKPGAELRDAVLARLDQPNLGVHMEFVMKASSDGSREVQMSGSMDIAPPDLAATMTIPGVPGSKRPTTVQVVVKDGVDYTRLQGGSWTRTPSTTKLPFGAFPKSTDLSGLEYVGPKKVGGRSLYLYRAQDKDLLKGSTFSSLDLSNSTVLSFTVELLVTADAVPVAMTAVVNGQTYQGGRTIPLSVWMHFDISHFGERIVIKAPSMGTGASG